MAITYIASTQRPDDSNAQAGSVSSNLLLATAGATTGDLVVVIAQYRGNATIQVGSETGGMTWNSLTQFNDTGNLCAVRIFWCRWDSAIYNGNNPNFEVVSGSGSIAFTTVGHIFRPTTSSNTWAVDNTLASTAYSAPSTPFTVTRTGVTTTQASTVAIASWFSEDDNTWGSLSGTGWSVLGDAQYRNTTGSDMSASFAYKVQTSSGATNNVSKNQATFGGDAGVTAILSFYEITSGAYTLAITAASFSVTNIAVGLLAARKIALSVTTYSLTPKNLNLLHGYKVIVSTASFILTNIAIGLSASRRVAISPLSLSVTPISTGLLIGKRLTLATSSYSLSYQNVGLSIQRRIVITTGSYLVTGQSIVLLATRRLSISTANYTVSLINVGLNSGFRLSISPASYALTTITTGLIAARTMPVTAISYAVMTNSVALRSARLLLLTPAAVSLTLADVGLLYGTIASYSLQINTMSLTLTRNQVGLLVNRTLQVNGISFNLANNNIQLLTGRKIFISTAPLITNWQTVALLFGRIFDVSTATYTLTGNDLSFYISTVNANQAIQLVSHINGSVAGQSSIATTVNNSSNIGSLIDSDSDINNQQQLNSNIITTN